MLFVWCRERGIGIQLDVLRISTSKAQMYHTHTHRHIRQLKDKKTRTDKIRHDLLSLSVAIKALNSSNHCKKMPEQT